MTRRMDRVGGLLHEEISKLIATELRDPRLRAMVTVTGVRMSVDLEHATVTITALGDEQERKDALKGLESAKGFLRRELAQRVELRHIPDLRFVLDTALVEGNRVLAMMDRMRQERQTNG
ncbi:MAG: 30S ribosome-binding factor RbfA [SAR202 cluster bacterium]|nr:30S ribosome-binding factor RbfA [SAR202 cluster bacterium]